jgi:hypothetical protein
VTCRVDATLRTSRLALDAAPLRVIAIDALRR